MRIAVIGCGYVGLVTGACLAEAGHDVMCTDIDAARIAQLQAGGVPIYEEHLEEVLVSARKAGRISYTSDATEAIRFGDAIFICVGTPPREDGSADLSAIDHVAQQIAAAAQNSKLIVEKSTVPARTGQELNRALEAYSRGGSDAAAEVLPIATLPELSLVRVAVHDSAPHLEVQWTLAGLDRLESRRVLETVHRLAQRLL